jgi:pyruvate kinase
MLESMIINPRPTRAEATDVANAVLDGSDAVMLSGETAAGKFPVESVKTMDRIICLIEKNSNSENLLNIRRNPDEEYPPELAIGHAACDAAQILSAKAIVCFTQSGSTAKIVSHFRPDNLIIAVTSKQETNCRLNLIWGVHSFSVHEFKENFDDAVNDIKKILLDKKIVQKSNLIVITAGLPFSMRRKTNMLRIEEI